MALSPVRALACEQFYSCPFRVAGSNTPLSISQEFISDEPVAQLAHDRQVTPIFPLAAKCLDQQMTTGTQHLEGASDQVGIDKMHHHDEIERFGLERQRSSCIQPYKTSSAADRSVSSTQAIFGEIRPDDFESALC